KRKAISYEDPVNPPDESSSLPDEPNSQPDETGSQLYKSSSELSSLPDEPSSPETPPFIPKYSHTGEQKRLRKNALSKEFLGLPSPRTLTDKQSAIVFV